MRPRASAATTLSLLEAMNARGGGVQALSMLNDLQFAVITDLVNGVGLTQKFVFEFYDVVVECAICAKSVRL